MKEILSMRHIARPVLTALALVIALAGAATGLAQEAKKPADDKKAAPAEAKKAAPAEKKAEPAKKPEPAKKAEPTKKPAAKPTADQFAALHDQWRAVFTELRSLKQKAATAKPEELKTLQQQFDAQIAKGEALLAQMYNVGSAAYKANPNRDRRLTRFLVKLLSDLVERDEYDQAYTLGRLLIDNRCDAREIFEQTGIAAFSTEQFDVAQRLLDEAQALDSLGTDGRAILDEVENYKKYWKREQELRKKEAAANDLPRVKLQTTKGDIVIELFENEAPETVGNFVSLVKSKFYDGLTFHRVLPGFMAQAGCPLGTGTGGPGYKIYCESDSKNARMHFRGTLSMAHSGKNTGGSQFFLTFRPTPHLNKKHTAFGRVVEGMDVLAKLQRRNPMDLNPPTPDKIVKAEVVRARDHEYVPNKVK